MNNQQNFRQKLQVKVNLLSQPQRTALSLRFPILKTPLISIKRFGRNFSNFLTLKSATSKNWYFFPNVYFRHQSTLYKKLGDNNARLQKQKVTNLKLAAQKLNGLVIKPGQTFSLWQIIGNPTPKKGYVKGMLLADGKVIEGVGGGLCQMANLLYWMFLHMPIDIVEHHHHSLDVFPDSGRVLPFGSGATIYYNYVDLRIKNTSSQPFQLKIWVNDTHLKGQILSKKIILKKFHIFEKNHCFVKTDNKYFRYNEIWRQTKIAGELIAQKKITENFSPVLYEVNQDYLKKLNYQVIEIATPKTPIEKAPQLEKIPLPSLSI